MHLIFLPLTLLRQFVQSGRLLSISTVQRRLQAHILFHSASFTPFVLILTWGQSVNIKMNIK